MFPERAYGVLRALGGAARDPGQDVGGGARSVCPPGQGAIVRRCPAIGQARGNAPEERVGALLPMGRHSAVDTGKVWERLAGVLLAAAGRRPVVAVDWTEWRGGLRVLAAGVCLGKGRFP